MHKILFELKQIYQIIPPKHHNKLLLIASIFLFLSTFDLIIVSLVSFLGSSLIKLLIYSDNSEKLIHIPLYNHPIEVNSISISYMCTAIGILLLTRFLSSTRLTRYAFNYLSGIGNEISRQLMTSFLQLHTAGLKKRSREQNLFVISTGPINLMTGVIGNLLLMLGDFFLILLMFIATLVVNFKMSLFVFSSLTFCIILLNKFLGIVNRTNSRLLHDLNIESDSRISEILGLKYEIALAGAHEKFAIRSFEIRNKIVRAQTELRLVSFKLRIAFEAIIIGVLLITFITTLAMGNVNKAATATSVFIFAFYRIATSSLQFQHNFLDFKRNLAIAPDTIEFYSEATLASKRVELLCGDQPKAATFTGEVHFKNVSFHYDTKLNFEIKNLNIHLKPGESICILGESGSGKSTLLKLLLGIYEPVDGEILINNMHPRCASKFFPGQISYVSQTTSLQKGSLLENVALSENEKDISPHELNKIVNSIEKAGLNLEKLQEISTLEWNGDNLSGGERQRLGIARALYNSSQIVVLDEPTNSLDSDTEKLVIDNLINADQSTKIIVTHNISISRLTDFVLILKTGKVEFYGNQIEYSEYLSRI